MRARPPAREDLLTKFLTSTTILMRVSRRVHTVDVAIHIEYRRAWLKYTQECEARVESRILLSLVIGFTVALILPATFPGKEREH
jgi:hypothetical protein